MNRDRRWPMLLAGALVLSVAPAAAQQAPPAADAPTSPDHVFVNGVLAVPGAPTDTDMAPAKFSTKNAADDALITVAYTFKTLTPEQRRAIYESLKGKPVGEAFNADVGTELPASVELHTVPDEVVKQVPQTKDFQFTVANDRVLLVSPPTRIVAGVFAEAR